MIWKPSCAAFVLSVCCIAPANGQIHVGSHSLHDYADEETGIYRANDPGDYPGLDYPAYGYRAQAYRARAHDMSHRRAIFPPPSGTGALVRSGLIGITGDYAGRAMVIRIDDRIVYSGTPYSQGRGAWELPYEVDIYPAVMAVTVSGCVEPVMMEIRGRDRNPTLVIRGCDIALYEDRAEVASGG